MGKLLQLQLTTFLLILCAAYSQCQTPTPMCPLLESRFPEFGVTITYSIGPNMRFDFTSAQYSPCQGESIGTIGRRTRFCELIAGELVWSGEEPECRLLLCDPNELSITDGFIRFTAELQPPEANYLNGGYLVGTQASYSCNEGFVLSIGNANEFCRRIFTSNVLTGAEWSVGSRSCIIVDCGSLSDPTNGGVMTTGTIFQSTATYSCDTGYTLLGGHTRTCQANEQWSGSEPACNQLVVAISPSGRPMAGQSFSLTCSLSGGASLQPTLSYQWTREGGSLMTSTATLNFNILYLSDVGQYSCQVILPSSKFEGEHTVAAQYTIDFMSLHIQLRLEGITNCRVYTEEDADMKTDDITSHITQSIESLCACEFSSSLISNSFIVCFDDSPSHVTYRALLTGSESVSAIRLARIIEQWIENDPIVVVQSAGLSVTNSCPVVIANHNSPECPENITNRIEMANPTSTTSPTSSAAVAGGVVAGVLAIAMLGIVVLLLLRHLRYGSKDMSDEKAGSQPAESPPVVMSQLPSESHDYEELSKLQEEAAYEVVDQPRPPPPAGRNYQLSACAAYAPTDFNTESENK